MMSYDWGKTMDEDKYNWLYLFVVLCILDTTIVTDMGFGPELYRRILASGLFLTASGGSKTHDALNHAYQFAQHEVAQRVFLKLRTKVDGEERRKLTCSYHAFILGSPFNSYSDDCMLMAWRFGIAWGQLLNRNAYMARSFLLAVKLQDREWESPIGVEENGRVIALVQASRDELSKICGDLAILEQYHEPMDGVSTSFLFKPFEVLCKDWYPLTSKVNENGIDKDGYGVNFLKFYFVDLQDELTKNGILCQ